MKQDEYSEWCVKIFNNMDAILKQNGVILWNVSYGSDGTVNKESYWIDVDCNSGNYKKYKLYRCRQNHMEEKISTSK